MSKKARKIDILGVEVDDISPENAVFSILRMAKDKVGHHYVVTANTEFVMLARRNPEFLRILNKADLVVADGAGVVLAKRIFGGKFQSRVTGVDLVEKLCCESTKRAIRVGFLGGFGDVAEEVKKRQIAKNPGLVVVLAEPGDPTIGHDLKLKRRIERFGGVDILFVAYGMGQQELWIDRVKNKLPVGVFIGVGGAFDYLSMVKKRAPELMQKTGVEWLWRLVMEPTRIWRMRVLPIFAILMFFNWFVKSFKKNFRSSKIKSPKNPINI